MKTAVVGSRSIHSYDIVNSILKQYSISSIVSGGAKGIDRLAERYALENNISTTIFKPDYKQHGRGAAFVRNKQIVLESEIVVAIWDGVSTGTKHALSIANKYDIAYHIWLVENDQFAKISCNIF